MRQGAQYWPDSHAMLARSEKLKTIFDGTKLPLDLNGPKTTTGGHWFSLGGMNRSFQPFSVSQSRPSHCGSTAHRLLAPPFPTFATGHIFWIESPLCLSALRGRRLNLLGIRLWCGLIAFRGKMMPKFGRSSRILIPGGALKIGFVWRWLRLPRSPGS